jgi:hypothetical protein
MPRNEVVRIGDVLALADLDAGGYVVGDAVVSDSLAVAVAEEEEFRPSLSPQEIASAQYVVVPRFHYSAQRNLARLVHTAQIPGLQGKAAWGEKIEQIESYVESLSQSGEGDADPLTTELRWGLRALYDERNTNEMELARTAGHPIAYGNVIQLRHSRTGKFVTFTKRRAAQNRLAMAVELVDDGDKGSWLRIQSAERARTDGGAVYYIDQIQLSSVKFTNIFLCTFQPYDAGDVPSAPGALPRMPGSPTKTSNLHLHTHNLSPEACHGRRAASQNANRGTSTLEVNGSAETYRYQLRPVRSCVTWRKWSQQDVEDDGENEVDAIFGIDVVTFTRSSAAVVLYGDPQSAAVWWASSATLDRDTSRRDYRMRSVNSYWRITPQETNHAGERLKSDGARVLIQHIATGMYLCDAGGGIVKLSPHWSSLQNIWQLLSWAHADEAARESLTDGSVVWIKQEKSSGFLDRWIGVGRNRRRNASLDSLVKHASALRREYTLDGSAALFRSPHAGPDASASPWQSSAMPPGVLGVAIKGGTTLDDADAVEVRLLARSEVVVIENVLSCRAFLQSTVEILCGAGPLQSAQALPPQCRAQSLPPPPMRLPSCAFSAPRTNPGSACEEIERKYLAHPLQLPVNAALPAFQRCISFLCRLCEGKARRMSGPRQDLLRWFRV